MTGHKKRFCSLNSMTYYKGLRKEEYDFYKAQGICVRCHKNAAEPNRVMCLECADKEKIRNKSQRERTLDKSRSQDLSKYYKLKEQGICTYCKKNPATPGKTKCEKCLAKIRNRRNNRNIDIPRSERVSFGLCYICGKKQIVPGHSVCADCYQIRLNSMNKCISSRKEGYNNYWRSENKLIFKKK